MTDRPLFDHAEIAARIPHAGVMCLLDAVTFWDSQRIVCRAVGHRAADHPLRDADGHLGIAAGIEYAAQAMAVHGSLVTEQASRAGNCVPAKPPPGLLASVRSVEMHVRRLDGTASALRIEATRIASDAQALVYAFELHAAPSDDDPKRLHDRDQSGDVDRSLSPQPLPTLLLSGRASVMLLADAA